MDFISELISKIEKGPVLDRDRGPRPKKRVRLKARRSPSKATKRRYRMSPSSRAKLYAYRAARDATIVGMWQHFGRACRAKAKKYPHKADSWKFLIDLDTWCLTWVNCCDIMVVEGQGIAAVQKTVPAWLARGRNRHTDVQLGRLDPSKPWTPENTIITYKGEILARFSGVA